MKFVLFEAALLLVIAHLLTKRAPFAWWSPFLGTLDQGQDASRGGPADKMIQSIGSAVRMAARALPWNIVCLPEAMAAKWMLSRRGHESTLCLGVGPNTEAKVDTNQYHAWLVVGGQTITGGELPDGFHCLARYV